MDLTIELHTTEQAFSQLEQEWLELLEKAHTNTIFQTPQFLATWWKTLGAGELHILTLRDDHQTLLGLVPLYLHELADGSKEASFIGCVNVSDYLDCIVDKNHTEEVYKTLREYLLTQTAFSQLYWCSLPEVSPTREFFAKNFPAVQEQVQDVAPYIPLPSSWEDYLSNLERKQRHEVKRKLRRLDEASYQLEVITNPKQATTAVDEFIALHKTSSAAKREFWNEAHLVFFKELLPNVAKMGWLKLFFLKINDERVASMLIFDYNDEYELYNSGFDPDKYRELSTGANLTSLTIQKAIADQKSVYDFLRGGEAYKYRLGGQKREVFDIALSLENTQEQNEQ